MSAMTNIESLIRQSQIVERMAQYAHRAVLALTRGDLTAFRNTNDTLRLLRAEIGEIKNIKFPDSDGDAIESLEIDRLKISMDIVKVAEGVIDQWGESVRREMAIDCRLDTAESCDLFLDVMLPRAWNYSTDMLFLTGDVTQDLMETVMRRGQANAAFIGTLADIPADLNSFPVINSNEKFINWNKLLPSIPSERLTTIRIGNTVDEKEIEAALKSYKSWLRQEGMNDATVSNFSLRWITQGCRNISKIAESYPLEVLNGLFTGRPAVIVSPGPSLEKNIGELHRLKGRALIIAPAQTLTRLVQASIIPDIVMATDPEDMTIEPYSFFRAIDQCRDSLFIGKANCHPNVLNVGFKRVFWTLNGTPDDYWLAELFGVTPLNISGGSVSISAFRLALTWGCTPIALVGQDLALAGDRQYSGDRENAVADRTKLHELPGYFGGTVFSPTDYFMYHDQFMTFARICHLQGVGGTIYNCTEGGAYIEGFQHLALSHFIQDHVESQNPFIPTQLVDEAISTSASAAPQRRYLLQGVDALLTDIRTMVTWYSRIDRWLKQEDVSAQMGRRIHREQSKILDWLAVKDFLSVPNLESIRAARYLMEREQSTIVRVRNVHAALEPVARTASTIEPIVEDQARALAAG